MKILSENKKARFSFDIIEKFEAGIVLTGQEVKSIKSGRINIASSYVTFQDEEAFLVNAKIPPYQPKNAPSDYNPERKRNLWVLSHTSGWFCRIQLASASVIKYSTASSIFTALSPSFR